MAASSCNWFGAFQNLTDQYFFYGWMDGWLVARLLACDLLSDCNRCLYHSDYADAVLTARFIVANNALWY